MANYQLNFLVLLLLLIGLVVLSTNNVQANNNVFNLNDYNTWDAISGTLSKNWTQNHECFIELNAIKNGLVKHKEWAMRVVDSWGNSPSGVMNGNLYEFGSFFECLNIKRDGRPYKTQYCVANLLGKTRPKISLGICLPAVCTVNHLQLLANDVIRTSVNDMALMIPKGMCQFQERITNWNALDFVTIGLFGIALLLMVASTGYDIFYTVFNRAKYQPFLVFSMYTNGQKLFSYTSSGPSSGTIQCIEGIRVISIASIVCAHTYLNYKHIPLRENVTLKEFMKSYRSSIAFTPIAVESFFVISGLLVSYKMFKLLKKDGKLNILSLYWNRYLRLTPLMAVWALVLATIFRFFGYGPIWTSKIQYETLYCRQHWWSTLLYIQNYVNPGELCNNPTWYLCVDMQLFIVAPVLVYMIHRFKKTTLIALLILILGCMDFMLNVYMKNDFRNTYHHYYELAYFPTHFRFQSWLIGFITGYTLFEYPKGSIRIPKKLNLCAWTFSLILLVAIVFGNHPFYQTTPNASALQHGLFDAINRIAWSICLSYMVFSCVHSSGGAINTFLSLPVWQIISKLTYALFLIHYNIISIGLYSIKTPPYFSGMLAFRDFISNFVLCAFIAIPLVLAFELPIDAFNKLSSGSIKPKTLPISTPGTDIFKNNEKTCESIKMKFNE